jgi:hypothetical protein
VGSGLIYETIARKLLRRRPRDARVASLFVIDPAVENSEYKLANHSTQKFATTHARRRGVLKDFTDYRVCLEEQEDSGAVHRCCPTVAQH